MVEIKIPAEIQNYKSKLVFGLSIRQILSIGGALAVCVPIGVLGNNRISEEILPWIIIITALPFIGLGFFSYKEMPFEEFMRVFLSFQFLPQKRVYEDTEFNLFHKLNEDILEIDILQQKIDSGEIETIDSEWSE